MRRYGFMFATEFTKKQVNVIYAKAKSGELKVEKWAMKELYELADYYGYDSQRLEEFLERFALGILRAIFEYKDMAKAQDEVDAFTRICWDMYAEKTRKDFDRTLVA